MLVLVMLVRPFVSCVFLFFAVALLACNSYKQQFVTVVVHIFTALRVSGLTFPILIHVKI
jgi:hypothetical protein